MKSTINLILVSFLLMTVGSVQGQTNAVERYFDEYRQNDQFTHVSVSSKMFELFLNFEREDPSEQKIIDIISKLKGLKVLVGADLDNAEDIYWDFVGKPYRDMEELMDIRETGKSFRFFITEEGDRISELAMVGYEGKQVFVLSLIGDIDLKEISELSEKMDIDGFQHFKKIDNQ